MRLLSLLALLFITAPAAAGQQDPLLSLPDGQVILNISATERREVAQDLLVANMSYASTNRDAQAVQHEINTAMADAVKRAKKAKDVKVNTGRYNLYETTDPRSKEKKWRGAQSLTLKSKDAEELLELTGDLQELGLIMNGLSYTLSPALAISTQDSLMEAALRQLQERANRAAAALGKSSAELRDVNVQGSQPQYHRSYKARSMILESAAMDMAAPVAEAGESTITLSVSARAILKP